MQYTCSEGVAKQNESHRFSLSPIEFLSFSFSIVNHSYLSLHYITTLSLFTPIAFTYSLVNTTHRSTCFRISKSSKLLLIISSQLHLHHFLLLFFNKKIISSINIFFTSNFHHTSITFFIRYNHHYNTLHLYSFVLLCSSSLLSCISRHPHSGWPPCFSNKSPIYNYNNRSHSSQSSHPSHSRPNTNNPQSKSSTIPSSHNTSNSNSHNSSM